jgi:hypothetical protein
MQRKRLPQMSYWWGLLHVEEAASDELLLICAGEEGRAETAGVPAAG